MTLILGKTKRFKRIEITWWGKSQWYKFRCFHDHIDLGIISFYNLPQKGFGRVFWRLVKILIKPLRVFYHKRYVNSARGQARSILALEDLKDHIVKDDKNGQK